MFSLPQLALVILFFPTVALGDVIHIPLTRHSSSSNRDINYYISAAKRLQAKYNIKGESYAPHGKRASSASSIQTFNEQSDYGYAAPVSIGTPPQLFKVILGTGSGDLSVPSTLCSSCNSTIKIFDPSRSSSINSTFENKTIPYGSGNVTGIVAQDVVSMGNFTLRNQTFLAIDQHPAFIAGSASGIMGLGFSALSWTRSTPFWQALGSQLAAPEMAFYLTRFKDDSSAKQEEPGGVFTLGGIDLALFTGSIEFLPMPPSSPTYYWLLTMSSITVQGQSVRITPGNTALFDTGTTLIFGPTADVNAIWAAVPGSASVKNYTGFFSFPCFTTVQVTLSFGGKAWPINVTDMNIGQVSPGSSQCLGAIADLSLGSGLSSSSLTPSWIVGDTFLKNVYSVFRADPPSIGFAQLSSAAGGSGAPNDASATTNGVGRSGNGGTSTRITSPGMMTTAMIVVLMCLL